MANLFKTVANGVYTSPFIIPIVGAFFALFVISIGLSIEDYMTTLYGYRLLPTAKANDWVVPLVALLPQVGQITFTFAFATNTNRRWAVLVAFGLHFFDVLTDVYFKANGLGLFGYFVAFVESEVLYTLGSEIALTFSVGMLFELMPYALKQLGALFERFAGGLFQNGDKDDDDEDKPASYSTTTRR